MFLQKIKLWIWRSLEKRQPVIVDVEKMPDNERRVFINNCRLLEKDETLNMLIDNLIKDKEDYIARKCSNRPLQVTEGELERYGIIILEELRSRIQHYAARQDKPENFDKFSIL